MLRKISFLVLFPLFFVSACSNQMHTVTIDGRSFDDVGFTDYTSHKTKESKIIFNMTDTETGNYCNVIFEKDALIKNNYQLISKANNNKNITATCLFGPAYHIQSKKYDSLIKLELVDMKKDNTHPYIHLTMRLINVVGKRIIKINDFTAPITTNDIDLMTNVTSIS